MKNYIKKFGIIFLIFISITGIWAIKNGTTASAVEIGKQLLTPEDGWQRIDDTNINIKYNGTWYIPPENRFRYNGTTHLTTKKGDSLSFKFYGSKIRYISDNFKDYPKDISIKIDNLPIEYFTAGSDKIGTYQCALYQKLDLPKEIHNVEITMPIDGDWTYGIADAIDIDSDGYLVPDNESISLNKSSMSLKEKNSEQLIATTNPEKVVGVTWTSSDPSIATVDSNGKVTAIKAGTATITATTADGSNLSATCEVTVTKPVSKIELNKTSNGLKVGETDNLVATVTPEDATNKNIVWTSSDKSVATVDENGKVIAIKTGAATITATAADGSNLSATCEVTVTQLVSKIELNKTSDSLKVGQTDNLVATVTPEDATNKNIVWTSSDKSVATVDENGKVTAIKAGAATITATAADGSNLSATCEVTVTKPVSKIELNKTTGSLQVGQTDNLVATVNPEDATNKNVIWTSSDTSIATVDSNGKVTAIKAGTVTITATAADGSNLSATCEVTVTKPVSKIELNKTTDSLQVGKEDNLVATVTPEDTTSKNVTWISSDTSVVTVDSEGNIRAIKAGSATVTATTTDGSNLSASCTITVTDPVTPSNPTGEATLYIELVDGQIAQYTVSQDEINKFIEWFENRDKDKSLPALYKFVKGTSTEYVVHDKIVRFGVR